MTKGIIYYTDFHVDENILRVCLDQLQKSFNGEIVSVTLEKSLDFGRNIVLENRVRSYPTMVTQILMALEASTTDYIFFTESDILYSPTHFQFIPLRDDIYYYNANNYRWLFKSETTITYDRLISLSSLCCSRELAIRHYKLRLKLIEELGLDKIKSHEPRWARLWGYEPGTKKKRRGGITDEDYETWESEYPNVDIRHKWTFSKPKVTLDSFKHLPINWKEIPIDKIEGWNIKALFNL